MCDLFFIWGLLLLFLFVSFSFVIPKEITFINPLRDSFKTAFNCPLSSVEIEKSNNS